MSTIALTSAKGAPGVSTAALALMWSWQRKVILAECDPAGSDAVPGVLQGQVDTSRSIGELPVMQARGQLNADFWGQLIDMATPRLSKLLLPGVTDIADSAGVAAAADVLAGFFASLSAAEPSFDVIADCGRLSAANTMWPLLHRADVVLLVVNGTRPSMVHAQMAVSHWRERLAPQDIDTLRLLVVEHGTHWREAARKLDTPVLGTLPYDRRAAEVLSLGPLDKLTGRNALVRQWRGLHTALDEAIRDNRVRRGARAVAHAQ